MKRTTKEERKRNAREFWQLLLNGYAKQVAIVINHIDSKTNPNLHRCQFVTNRVNGPASKVIIAESVDGIEGCFNELISAWGWCNDIKQVSYWEIGFGKWLKQQCKVRITYNDGLVIMLER